MKIPRGKGHQPQTQEKKMETKMYEVIVKLKNGGVIRPMIAASIGAEALTIAKMQYPQPQYFVMAVNEVK